MRLDSVDRYGAIPGPIQRIPTGLKLLLALGWIVTTILLPSDPWIGLAISGAPLLVIARISRVPAGFLARRLISIEPIVLGVALLSLTQPGGWHAFLITVTKSTICVSCLILLVSTTRFPSILRTLRALRVPGLLVTTLALTYRYLFLLADEAGRMRRARASRTFAGGRRRTWRALAGTAGRLFVRSSERAERIYDAMCARGWRT